MKTETDWRLTLPDLPGLSAEVSAVLGEGFHLESFSKGTRLFGPGEDGLRFLYPVTGTIRVQQRGEAGREVVLYRVRADDEFTLATACQLSFETRDREAIAETDVRVMPIPRDAFDRLMAISKEFRALIFAACSKRITDFLAAIEEFAVARVDVQMARKLSIWREPVETGHARHMLSIELGTAPDIVSQYLGEFERRGWLSLEQGRVEMTNVSALRGLADQPV